MFKIQSHLPVIVDTTRQVVGSIPLHLPIGWSGSETTVVLGGHTVPLAWAVVDTVYKDRRCMAYVPITQSDFRQGKFPVYFQRNPDFYFPQFHAERDVLHWGPPPIPDFWKWIFIRGATMVPEMPEPPVPVVHEAPRWTIEVPMLSSAECAFIDLDWTQFAPPDFYPVSLAFPNQAAIPSFLQTSLISADMSQAMAGLTQAEATPILRVYRINAPVAGTYSVPMEISARDATHEFLLDIVIV